MRDAYEHTAVPATMCRRCGCPDAKHENAADCIDYWRDRTAVLELKLASAEETHASEREDIPRFVAGRANVINMVIPKW